MLSTRRAIIVTILTSIAAYFYGVSNAKYNWDVIGYVSTIHYENGFRGSDLSLVTYDDIRKEVSAERFDELTLGSDYSRIVFEDPAALEQHVPFYRIRFLYTSLVQTFANVLGVTLTKSSVLVSALFTAMCVVMLGALLLQQKISVWTLPIIVLLSGIIRLGKLSTPDSMAAFIMLAATYTFIRGTSFTLAICLIIPLVRTDFVIFSLLLIALSSYPKSSLIKLSCVLGNIVSVAAINHWSGNYGWLTIFNFTLIEITPYPLQLTASTSIWDYLEAYRKGLFTVATAYETYIAVGAVAGGFYKIKPPQPLALVAALLMLGVALHFLAFPAFFTRFYFAHIAILCIVYLAARGQPTSS